MPDEAPAPNRTVSRRSAMIGGALAAASAYAFVRQPAVANPIVPEKTFETWVPRQFGRWTSISESGVVLPPPDALRDRLYDNLVTRVYASASGVSVMMLLAYNNAQDGVLQLHRPETCYPVGGYALSGTREVDIPVGGRRIPANFFTATGPDRVEQVQYFTRLGDAFPRNWAEQRMAVIRANIAGDIPDGMMMRVSTLGMDAPEAETLLDEFSRSFILHSNARLQHLLLGATSST
ncbi:exosortase-associated protein EpsI, V-type [Sphingopyxis sp. Q841]|uniref:exosortase-associated protein EpsI, V-type n=1 Tax=Sphingopyxis sp. Q841 TaxID=3458250 RepID=UPI004035BB12